MSGVLMSADLPIAEGASWSWQTMSWGGSGGACKRAKDDGSARGGGGPDNGGSPMQASRKWVRHTNL